MSINTIASASSTGAAGNTSWSSSLSNEDRQKLVNLAAEFESMLLNNMLRDMRETGKWSDDSESNVDTLGADVFEQTFDTELSRYLSKSGGLGLSQQLLRALEAVAGDTAGTGAATASAAHASTAPNIPSAPVSSASPGARTGWNNMRLDAPTYGGSGAQYAGFNNDRAVAGGDDESVKDAFFRWTYGLDLNPAGLSKAEIQQQLSNNLASAREYGLNVLDIQGEHILIETQERGAEWIDVVVNAGSSNPNEVKWQWLPLDEGGPMPAAGAAATAPGAATASTPSTASTASAGLNPSAGVVTSNYGWRQDPFTGQTSFHSGVDLRAPEGTEIQTASGGKVVFSGTSGGYGTNVVVEHANGLSTRYAHLSDALVALGDEVKDGQVIGRSGQTGRATAAHLHYEVLENGVPVDPRR